MLEGRRQRFVDLWDRIVADEISPKTRKILALAAVLVFAGDALLTAWSFVYYPTQTTDTSVFYRLLHPTIGAWWIPINFAVGLAMILALSSLRVRARDLPRGGLHRPRRRNLDRRETDTRRLNEGRGPRPGPARVPPGDGRDRAARPDPGVPRSERDDRPARPRRPGPPRLPRARTSSCGSSAFRRGA